MRDLLLIDLTDREILQELPRTAQSDVGVVCRPHDPIRSYNLIDELELREVEHATRRDPDIVLVDLADLARKSCWLA